MTQAMLQGRMLSRSGGQHMGNLLAKPNQKDLAFVTALGDFVTSIILYTYDTRPLSLEILASLRQGDVGVASAYGVFLMALSALVFALGSERKVVIR